MFVNRKALLTKARPVPVSVVCLRGGAEPSLKTNKHENRGLTIISEKRKGPPTEACLPLGEQTEGRPPSQLKAHSAAPRGGPEAQNPSPSPSLGVPTRAFASFALSFLINCTHSLRTCVTV